MAAVALPLFAQRQSGELRLTVTDAAGLALEATVEAMSQATDVRVSSTTDARGQFLLRDLPFGPYRVRVSRAGFSAHTELVQVQSETPLPLRVTLQVAPLETGLVITERDTLLDPQRTGTAYHVGRESIETRRSSAPSRSVLELVNRQPGWLLEANGVLHPRGSEYDTQYVIDGIPVLDNRSPAFAPAFEAEELASMRILTGGYPAEYGRKLGGVVELSTARETRDGFHGRAVLQGGSFGTRSGYLSGQLVAGRTVLGLSAQGTHTDRFLDPPVERNFENRASSAGGTARLERQLSENDRLRFYFHQKRVGFLVPNELIQQEAGQRQDRRGEERMGQAAYQRALSPRWIFDARVMVRDVSAKLWSNELATPVIADQDRGFLEAYATASASASLGRHSLKFGAETVTTRVRERFGYRITDEEFFEDDDEDDDDDEGGEEVEFPEEFRFQGRRTGREHSAYVQDTIRAGNLTVNAGLRWDRYRFLVTESFVSPRIGAAYHVRPAGVVLRASYDRAITVPAVENLLLASSIEAQRLTARTSGMPVRPARGNFFEAGFSKSMGPVRLDGSWYRRNVRNYADDDVFLNTGVSFPIAFDRATIRGYEAKLELPRWRRWSGYLSYSNLVGTGFLPVTGGLFLEDDVDELLHARTSFPISQDQRNTVQGRVRHEWHPRVWTALGFAYNSGLPVEREGEFEDEHAFDDLDGLRERYGARVVSHVDFRRGRVKPSHAFDVSAGVTVWQREGQSVKVQADALNLTNRLNVINFAGLFSGTALGAPRTVQVRMQLEF